MLDGELTILDGKAYQTKANGETTILKDDKMIAFSSVTFLNLIWFLISIPLQTNIHCVR